jgi:hypothetical protein
MSYSKLEVRFIGDGVPCNGTKARDGEKKRVVSLPKRVQEYGDRYGYSSLTVTYDRDHLIIKGGGEVLFDRDINGDANIEYITRIVDYTWLD